MLDMDFEIKDPLRLIGRINSVDLRSSAVRQLKKIASFQQRCWNIFRSIRTPVEVICGGNDCFVNGRQMDL